MELYEQYVQFIIVIFTKNFSGKRLAFQKISISNRNEKKTTVFLEPFGNN